MIYVVELQYFDTADDTVKTLRVATEGFATKPSDTPANTVIHGRIKQPALIRRDIFAPGTTGGQSRVDVGELVLANEDGQFDAITTWSLDGRSVVIRYADTVSVAYPSAYSTLFTGTMEQVTLAQDVVRIRLRDNRYVTTGTFQPNKYGGTNVLPAGIDGLPSDLKGKPKPWVGGAAWNVEPACVNTSLLIYQVHDGANFGTCYNVTNVYDSGAQLAHEPDYASQADMEANAPSQGAYRVWLAGGLFRLGSSAVGQVTVDVARGIPPATRTAAALFREVLEDAGVSSGNISATDCAALDAANSATLGLYVREETTVQAVLDQITQSVGAWWSTDVGGVFRVQRLEAPSGTPVASFTADTIEELRLVPLNQDGNPIYRATVRGVPNNTVQTTGLAGSVTADRRARLALPYQDGIATDATVQTAFPEAPEFVVESRLACLGAVQTEAARLLALYSVRRFRFELVVSADAATLAALDLGVVIRITYSRFGLAAGSLFRVLGYKLDPTRNRAELTVWG